MTIIPVSTRAVKSLQRLDKAELEIKEKQYEALSSVVLRNKNDM
jgi:hypothetical protein